MSNFKSDVRMDLWCRRNDTEEDPYEYCAAFNVSMDFTSQIKVNSQMRVILTISNLYLYFNNVIETKVGNLSLFSLNLSIRLVVAFVTIIINTFLQGGFDLNWILHDLIGINFVYFKAFELVEDEAILFAKITPGWNITWNESVPAFTRPDQSQHVFDLSKLGLGNFLEETAKGKGIE